MAAVSWFARPWVKVASFASVGLSVLIKLVACKGCFCDIEGETMVLAFWSLGWWLSVFSFGWFFKSSSVKSNSFFLNEMSFGGILALVTSGDWISALFDCDKLIELFILRKLYLKFLIENSTTTSYKYFALFRPMGCHLKRSIGLNF